MSRDRPLRILAVAALPYPSRQGTQVLLHAMCQGLARRGHDVCLLVHAHRPFEVRADYRIRRLLDVPRSRSLRSGPSARRVALDLQMTAAVRLLARRLRPDVVHLHNVEAAAAALIGPCRPTAPCVYHAHNLMEHELPLFADGRWRDAARRFGAWLDRVLPALADLTLAVSRPTADRLVAAGADPRRLEVVEPGLDLDDVGGEPTPAESIPRAAPDAPPTGTIRVGHLGNLDPYQGVPRLFEAAERLVAGGTRTELLFVTESDPRPVLAAAAEARVTARAVAHGPIDGALAALRTCACAAVCRNVPGGFPIKLPVLFGAGIPVAAVPSAVDGLGVEDAVIRAADDSADALADAIVLAAGPEGARRSEAGRLLAGTRFSSAAAAERLERALRDAARGANGTR
jgi:glycosyltransferase involved in cell wall biosynthesis